MAVKIRPEVAAIADDVIAIRRDIHKYPELDLMNTAHMDWWLNT